MEPVLRCPGQILAIVDTEVRVPIVQPSADVIIILAGKVSFRPIQIAVGQGQDPQFVAARPLQEPEVPEHFECG